MLQLVEEEVSEEPSLAADELVASMKNSLKIPPLFKLWKMLVSLLKKIFVRWWNRRFLEEAEELLEQAQGLLKQWFEQRGNRSLLLQLQRNAHSLKRWRTHGGIGCDSNHCLPSGKCL